MNKRQWNKLTKFPPVKDYPELLNTILRKPRHARRADARRDLAHTREVIASYKALQTIQAALCSGILTRRDSALDRVNARRMSLYAEKVIAAVKHPNSGIPTRRAKETVPGGDKLNYPSNVVVRIQRGKLWARADIAVKVPQPVESIKVDFTIQA